MSFEYCESPVEYEYNLDCRSECDTEYDTLDVACEGDVNFPDTPFPEVDLPETNEEKFDRELAEDFLREKMMEWVLSAPMPQPIREEPVTEQEIEEEYEKFHNLLVQDRLALQRAQEDKIVKLAEWQMHTGKTVVGKTTEEKYADMERQIREENEAIVTAFRQEQAERRKLEQAEAKATAERSRIIRAKASQIAHMMREKSKSNAPNAKGKLQGKKQVKKVKAKPKTTRVEINFVTRMQIVPQISLDDDDSEDDASTAPSSATSEICPRIEVAEPIFGQEQKPKALPTTTSLSQPTLHTAGPNEPSDWKTVSKPKRNQGTPKVATQGPTQGAPQASQAVSDTRMKGYLMLADSSSLREKLTKTQFCNSLIDGVPCKYGDRCRFAHSPKELVRKDCFFGTGCRYAKAVAKGFYQNIADRNSGRICNCWHPDESPESYAARMGVKSIGPKVAPKEPKKLELKVPVQPKLAPWAKVGPKK